MHSPLRKTDVAGLMPLEIRVCSADCEPLCDRDLRRLFPGSSLTQPRLDRLRLLPRVAIMVGGRVVATATCQKVEEELRVPDLGIDGSLPEATTTAVRGDREIINALLDAIEMAALAAGCQRVIVNPPKVSLTMLERRGYRQIHESCAGSWIEKTVG